MYRVQVTRAVVARCSAVQYVGKHEAARSRKWRQKLVDHWNKLQFLRFLSEAITVNASTSHVCMPRTHHGLVSHPALPPIYLTVRKGTSY
ncbi:hypothetical protein E2C01_036810 [Portunus trituberculatus]|uniref:Uncharacterized protein n=1 Tax=Portunus trituberculatus TaxID=210409 RepID=A0A5B7F9P8_PORTR|nr:hypothetical protein [Portunus trituberculatus]